MRSQAMEEEKKKGFDREKEKDQCGRGQKEACARAYTHKTPTKETRMHKKMTAS